MTSSLDTKNTASLDSITSQKTIIEDAFSSDVTQWSEKTKDTIRSVIADLDTGDLRIAHFENQQWHHHSWVQKAILCYFKLSNMMVNQNPILPYKDKIDSKFNLKPLDQL